MVTDNEKGIMELASVEPKKNVVGTYSVQKVSESVIEKEQTVISNEEEEGKKPLNLLAKKTEKKKQEIEQEQMGEKI